MDSVSGLVQLAVKIRQIIIPKPRFIMIDLTIFSFKGASP